jgi:O-antigen/teichoic acid export membrane protein
MQRDFHQAKEELIHTENEPGSVELLKGAGIVFSGRLVGRGLGFLSHFLFARFLGPTQYGIFLLSVALFNFAGLFADLGLRSGVLRESAAAEGRGDHDMVRGTILGGAALAVGASLLAAGALLVMRGWAASSFKAPDLGWLLPLFALSLPFATAGAIFISGLQALRRMEALSTLQYVLDPLLRIVTFIGLFFLGWRLFAVGASHLLASVAVALFAFLWLSSSFPLVAPPILTRFQPGPLLTFSLPLLMSNVLGFILQWADSLFLGYYMTVRDVGVYGAAGRLAGLGGMFLLAISTIFAPKIYSLYGKGELPEVGRLYQHSTRWVLTCILPLFFYTVLNAEPLLALFGPEFAKGSHALIILAAAYLVMTGTGPAGDVVLMTGRSKAILYASAASGALGLGLNFYLIPRFGLIGAAVATGLAISLGNLANVLMAWWFTGLQPYTKAIAKPILTALCVAGVHAALGPILGEEPLPQLVGGAVIWLIYPLILCRLGFEAEDREVWGAIKESRWVPSSGTGMA